MKLTDRERKLLLLAFDPAAAPGETVNAVCALAKAWLAKYEDGHALIKDLEAEPKIEIREKVVYRTESPFARTVLQFGKHRGKQLNQVDPGYLLWVLENFDSLWPQTRQAIERYLDSRF
jgi:hypothetical protein